MLTRAMRGVAALALVTVALPSPGHAQDAATLDAGFEAVRAKQRFLISGTIVFTDAESAAFWPQYDKYQAEQARIDQRASAMMSEYLAGRTTLTAATADSLTEQQLNVEEDYLKALRAHAGALKGILPAVKLAKYVQLQRRLDVSLRYDLSQRIPQIP
jgi:hypothetical protein